MGSPIITMSQRVEMENGSQTSGGAAPATIDHTKIGTFQTTNIMVSSVLPGSVSLRFQLTGAVRQML